MEISSVVVRSGERHWVAVFPGIFAAGDVRANSSKRVAAAIGEGSGTVGMVHRYLETV
jgi:thioredoxin reductase